ncbi:MAG: dockerin type I repeat-containing protein, partial [Candidatus Zixiibacteriota bacterium]
GFYNLENGAMQFHRRVSSPALAGHRVAPIMVDGYLIATCGNKMFALTGKDARPRLDIPKYAINVPVDFGSPDHYPVEFPDALGNVGGAPLTIDSIVLGGVDNGTSPPVSASIGTVSGDRVEAMGKMAKKFAGNAEKLRALLPDVQLLPADEITTPPSQTGKAAYAPPSWIYGVIYPAPGTVIPAQYPYNDSSAYIDIVLDVNGTQIPRGTHSFYAYIYSDDPDYFLDSARMDYETAYLPPQIKLSITGGCTYDDVAMYFGVGATNYAHVWNATKLADGDLDDSWDIDGDNTSFWQGAYIFAAEQTGVIPPGKPSLFSARVVHYAENWSGVNPMAWQSILADPDCYEQTCPPSQRTEVLLGTVSHNNGATYDNVFGEIVCYAFVDSAQDMCQYDDADNCEKWDWTAAESGTQPPYSDTLTIGFRGCVTVIGAYDEPLLNNFVIHRFDLSGRYGPVNELYMGAMLDYDIIPNVYNVAGYDQEHSLAYAYPCNTNDNCWGMVRIPFGDEYQPMINARTLTARQAGWNDSAVWLDSVYYWMSTLTGLSHQTGIDPVLCNIDSDDREVFFTIAGLELPANPESETIGVAVFGMPGVTDASDPATYSELADIANMWCGFGRGDVNKDKRIDLVDIAYLIEFVFYGGNGPYPFRHLGDVNADGVINGNDVTYLIDYYLGLGPAPAGRWTLGQ